MRSAVDISIIKVREYFPSLLLIILFLFPSIKADAAYCGQQLNTYQATSANGPDQTLFYNLIYFYYEYPANKSYCNGPGIVYLSYSKFDSFLSLKSNFAIAQTDITSLKSENVTIKADISSLKADNVINKNDIASLRVDVNNLKSSSPSTSGQTETIYSYADAASFWGLAFTSVFSLWLIARSSGTIIDAVRRF